MRTRVSSNQKIAVSAVEFGCEDDIAVSMFWFMQCVINGKDTLNPSHAVL